MAKKPFNYRRLLQFRLRTLMAVFLLAPLAVGWWQIKMQSYREQQIAVAEIMPLVRHIVYEPGQPAWLRHFSDEKVFKDVVHLSLQGSTPFQDKDAKHLAKIPRLRRLSLQRTGISDQALKHLARLKELDTLSLESTRVSDDGMMHLSGLSSLRVLQASDTWMSGRGLRHLTTLPKLERVEVVNDTTDVDDMKTIGELPRLRELCVWVGNLSGPGYEALCGIDQLERLELRGEHILRQHIEGMPNLKSLEIGVWKIYRVTVREMPKLTSLELASPIEGDLILASLPQMKELNLSGREISAETLASVAQLSNLRELKLHYAKLSFDAWPQLANLSSVRKLDLTGAQITGERLPHIAGLVDLHELKLGENTLQTKDLPHLNRLINLKKLDLHNTDLFDNALVRSGPRASLRDSEMFRDVFVPDDGFRSLLELKSLEYINLIATDIESEELRLLKGLPKLKMIELDAMPQGDQKQLQRFLDPISITGPTPPLRLKSLGRLMLQTR